MNNPIINRWGINLFWYNFWYNDKISSLTNHQDVLIEQLVYTYIHYGLLLNKSLFLNNYWYPKYKKSLNSTIGYSDLKYFRNVEYKNRATEEHKSYKLRIKIKNLYYSKIWILRYQNWLLVNFYTYKPFKTKNTFKIYRKLKNVDNFLIKTDCKFNNFFRYKIIFLSLINSFKNAHQYYKF